MRRLLWLAALLAALAAAQDVGLTVIGQLDPRPLRAVGMTRACA